jgi:hypothetical protein|tara:strand:- start:1155 stop:1544 length:390 start_codon:yes stop_codon:yes gene_type:complete
MAKKSVKKGVKKKSTNKLEGNLENKIIQNLVSLQKVHINLAEKFDNLSEQISGLLALFENTARTFAKQAPSGITEKDKEFLEKIDKLLDQNKTIAKGLTLMESKMREKIYGPIIRKPEENPRARKLAEF